MNTDMLTCEDALERMSQALDGPLPLEERQALEEHLESCPECRAAYEALFQMEDALREIGETPAPAELSARVMEQIQAEAAPARRPAPRWNRAGWRNLAGLAACAVLCLGLWHGAGLGSRENVVDEPSAASQSAGQEDASSRGLLDEMEPAQEEDPVDAQPAPAQADAPEEDAPESGILPALRSGGGRLLPDRGGPGRGHPQHFGAGEPGGPGGIRPYARCRQLRLPV